MKKIFSGMTAVLLLCISGSAFPQAGQAYPSKPIRIIVGLPPGGANDILARLVGNSLQETLGQPVIIDNKPGANMIIAAEAAAKGAPDGHTLFVGTPGPMAINPAVYTARLPYDPEKSFTPISQLGLFPVLLVVHPSVPANSVQEFIAYAKANPGKLDCSTGSVSFHFATELLKQMTGTEINHIPYKGSIAAINAAAAGEVKVAMTDSKAAFPYIKSGKLRVLGVTSARRTSFFPDVPTIAEAGVQGYELSIWVGLFAPAGTPGDIVSKLNAQVVRILNAPEVREKLLAIGVDVMSSTPEQLAELIKQDTPKYRMPAKNAGIKLD